MLKRVLCNGQVSAALPVLTQYAERKRAHSLPKGMTSMNSYAQRIAAIAS